ncbi:hypothetical protein RsoM2USA_22 [Ralstonia phage RsoM2USA]|nr:hypothetical protein RsoM2USA_22 [Ralstonia phage RsoM2USA]
MSKKYDLLVLIGRFQPIHDGHISLIEKAYSMAEEVLVIIGSTGIPRDIDNPFTFSERAQMIGSCFVDTEIKDHLTIMRNEDTIYNNDKWIGDVQSRVSEFKDMHPEKTIEKIGLIGYDKDATTWYLNAFPQWDLVEAEYHDHINATEIREAYLRGVMKSIRMFVHPNVFSFLQDFMKTDSYKYLVEWRNFQDEHDARWAFSPYKPTFNTADAVVTQSGHILLVKRKHAPGKGLWALPGGYVGNDTYRDAAIRELVEETRIKLQREVLNRAIVSEKIFDHPKRSTRGRIITMAFHFKLSQMGKGLPKVKGDDDAEEAKWFTFEEFRKMRGQMFEDHWDIGCAFIGY